jgi:hypothetical protein
VNRIHFYIYIIIMGIARILLLLIVKGIAFIGLYIYIIIMGIARILLLLIVKGIAFIYIYIYIYYNNGNRKNSFTSYS